MNCKPENMIIREGTSVFYLGGKYTLIRKCLAFSSKQNAYYEWNRLLLDRIKILKKEKIKDSD